ncbi:MAG: hypothetical protein ACR2HC_03135 [Thermoleophilaceae bacterium]
MDPGERTDEQHIEKVVLPSGKTIAVVYFGEGREHAGDAHAPVLDPDLDLHVCRECGSLLAYPTAWEEAGEESWSVEIRCPECETMRQGIFAQDVVEAFDEALDSATEALTADYRRLMRANMAAEIDRFAGALRAGALLPEDF